MDNSGMYDETKFRYDLDAFGVSIKEKNFKDANIFANRIMSNAVIFDKKEYGIIGHILKEIAVDGLQLQQSIIISEVPTYAKHSSKVVGLILKLLETKMDLEQIWDSYNQHQNDTHQFFMSKIEKNAYLKSDTKFSKNVIAFLIEYIRKIQKLFEECLWY